MIFLIAYDIDEDKRDYENLYRKIRSLGGWMHFIDSAWLVSSNRRSADRIADELIKLIDKEDDYLIVTEITTNNQGWLPDEAWAWLKEEES